MPTEALVQVLLPRIDPVADVLLTGTLGRPLTIVPRSVPR